MAPTKAISTKAPPARRRRCWQFERTTAKGAVRFIKTPRVDLPKPSWCEQSDDGVGQRGGAYGPRYTTTGDPAKFDESADSSASSLLLEIRRLHGRRSLAAEDNGR